MGLDTLNGLWYYPVNEVIYQVKNTNWRFLYQEEGWTCVSTDELKEIAEDVKVAPLELIEWND